MLMDQGWGRVSHKINQLVGRTSASSLAPLIRCGKGILKICTSSSEPSQIFFSDMALRLGKRKRREELIDENVTPGQLLNKDNASEMHNILRRHFEAAFEPLADHQPLPAATTKIDPEGSEAESESDWEGISEGQIDSAEIINHAKSSLSKADIPKEEIKTFMVSANKIPCSPNILIAIHFSPTSPRPLVLDL